MLGVGVVRTLWSRKSDRSAGTSTLYTGVKSEENKFQMGRKFRIEEALRKETVMERV